MKKGANPHHQVVNWRISNNTIPDVQAMGPGSVTVSTGQNRWDHHDPYSWTKRVKNRSTSETEKSWHNQNVVELHGIICVYIYIIYFYMESYSHEITLTCKWISQAKTNYLSIYLSVCLSVCLSVFLPIYLSIYIYIQIQNGTLPIAKSPSWSHLTMAPFPWPLALAPRQGRSLYYLTSRPWIPLKNQLSYRHTMSSHVGESKFVGSI